jgi:hypothetical protein
VPSCSAHRSPGAAFTGCRVRLHRVPITVWRAPGAEGGYRAEHGGR